MTVVHKELYVCLIFNIYYESNIMLILKKISIMKNIEVVYSYTVHSYYTSTVKECI